MPPASPSAARGRHGPLLVIGESDHRRTQCAPASLHLCLHHGGIGPTHGDITADCVAKAFGVPIDSDPRALAILHEWMKTTGAEMNEARLHMTRIPKCADLILKRCRGRLASGRRCNRDGWRVFDHAGDAR
jgi:molybdopterin-biosynthesis enzyme MoeA-like protein